MFLGLGIMEGHGQSRDGTDRVGSGRVGSGGVPNLLDRVRWGREMLKCHGRGWVGSKI